MPIQPKTSNILPIGRRVADRYRGHLAVLHRELDRQRCADPVAEDEEGPLDPREQKNDPKLF